MDTSDAERRGRSNAPKGVASPVHVLRYYTTGICIYFFVFLFFLNNERILMPHIDYTLYVQTKGELEKVR